jgi:hypothetical protein
MACNAPNAISSLFEATPSISWPEASQFSMIVLPSARFQLPTCSEQS